MSSQTPPTDGPLLPSMSEDDRARASAALQEAFTRLQPQGSDTWNYAGAFAQLSERFGPYGAETLGVSKLLLQDPPAPGLRGRISRWRSRSGEPAAAGAGLAELEQAMAPVVEAFRFLAARVKTLEDRLAREDRPVEGAAWLTPARDLGPWVAPLVDHIGAQAGGGVIVHGDCGSGSLVRALGQSGLGARGVEPRGAVALAALEDGCAVSIREVGEELTAQPDGALGGLVLSGVVDRLALHDLLVVLGEARRTLAHGGPLVIVIDPATGQSGSVGRDLVGGFPLHTQTWEILLDRAGFADVATLPGAEDGRVALTAVART